MFDVKTKGEIKKLNVRKEFHGDDLVRAIDIKMMLIGVPVEKLTTAVPDMAKRFYEGDVVAVGEVSPLIVGHRIENLAVKINDVEFKGANIKKKMKLHLLPGKIVNIELSVQVSDFTNKQLTRITDLYIESEVKVEIFERQLSMVDSA